MKDEMRRDVFIAYFRFEWFACFSSRCLLAWIGGGVGLSYLA